MNANLLFVLLLSVVCVGACYANPVALPISPSFGGELTFDPVWGTLIDCVVDFIALSLGYLIIGNCRFDFTKKFIGYFVLVYLAGFIIDIIAMLLVEFCNHMLGTNVFEKFELALFAAIILYLGNFFLALWFFKLKAWQARVIGLTMAILTNPVLGWMLALAVHVNPMEHAPHWVP